jgi:ribulose-phosphate 3-epimerase
VAINPATPLDMLADIAPDLDIVILMSVNPGFGGQTFIPRSESKVREVRALLDRVGNKRAEIEIDGGIDLKTVERVVAAGARILVAGNALFNQPDPEQATRALKAAAQAALPTAASSSAAR